jgi:hypothetical protein
MPLLRKRRIWWEAVQGASGYVVYAASQESLFDSGNFKWEATPGVVSRVVDGKTDIIIPDEWPEFPNGDGIRYIGVTSRDEAGNQSDPFVSSGLFKSTPPQAPVKGGIESL